MVKKGTSRSSPPSADLARLALDALQHGGGEDPDTGPAP